jgi:phospholipase/carboxylesterase
MASIDHHPYTLGKYLDSKDHNTGQYSTSQQFSPGKVACLTELGANILQPGGPQSSGLAFPDHRLSSLASGEALATTYSIFVPIHYEPGYAYPLIVWMHGPGDNENQLRTVLPLVSMRNHVAIAPLGTDPDSDVHGAFCWKQSGPSIIEATDRVLDCIRIAMKRHHIHPERVFIAGYDCGGTMAMRIALQNPEYFAGAISIGGPLPRGLNILKRVNDARHLPLLFAISSGSSRYTPTDACDDLRLLHSAGFSLDLRQYPCGDELTTKMLSDMDSWILNRICPQTVTAAP